MSAAHSKLSYILFALALAFPLLPNRAAATGAPDLHPDLILFNGNIVTDNQDFETGQESRRNCCRTAVLSGRLPVQSSNEIAACSTSMPRPS